MSTLEKKIEQPFLDRILFIGGEGEGIPKLRDDVAKCVFMGTPAELIAAVVAVLPTADVSDHEVDAMLLKGTPQTPMLERHEAEALTVIVRALLDAQAAAHAAYRDSAEDARHALAIEAFTAPDADWNTILDSLRARVANLVLNWEDAEADRDRAVREALENAE